MTVQDIESLDNIVRDGSIFMGIRDGEICNGTTSNSYPSVRPVILKVESKFGLSQGYISVWGFNGAKDCFVVPTNEAKKYILISENQIHGSRIAMNIRQSLRGTH